MSVGYRILKDSYWYGEDNRIVSGHLDGIYTKSDALAKIAELAEEECNALNSVGSGFTFKPVEGRYDMAVLYWTGYNDQIITGYKLVDIGVVTW